MALRCHYSIIIMATTLNDEQNNNEDCGDDNLFDDESDNNSVSSGEIPEPKRRRTTNAAETSMEESLFDLISNKDWNKVIQRVQELRAHYSERERIPELHETEPTFHMTPLYAALMREHDAPVSAIHALLDSFTIQDEHDFLQNPLLSACAIKHAEPVITRMLEYKPSLILATDDNGMTFLHILLQNQPSLTLVELLVSMWARESNIHNMDTAWKRLLSMYDGHGVLPIHYAIEFHANDGVIVKLLEKYPESARMSLADDVDISTVHHAAFHGCSHVVLKTLLQHYGPLKLGDVGKNRSNKKDTPLHLLFHPEAQDQWLITPNSTTTNMSRYKMAWFFIEQYSKVLSTDFGVKKANKVDEAHKLVFSIKGNAGKSVYTLAADLAETYPDCEPLGLLLRDFDLIIHKYCREWPHLDYESNDEPF
jgi:hypothetical protein